MGRRYEVRQKEIQGHVVQETRLDLSSRLFSLEIHGSILMTKDLKEHKGNLSATGREL